MKKQIQLYQQSFAFIFNIIKETFPFSSKEDFLNFKQVYKKHYNDLLWVEDDANFFAYLRKFLASLRNSHTRLGKCPAQNLFKPNGYDVVIVNNKFYLKKQNKIIAEIISINNKKIKNALKEKISATSGSTKQYLTRQALKNIFVSRKNEVFNLKLKNDNQKFEKILFCQPFVFKASEEKTYLKIFKGNLGYIKIPSWGENISEGILENKVKLLAGKKVKVLIVDVRGNSGGNSNIAKFFASHFFNKKVVFSTIKKRVSKSNFNLEKIQSFVMPREPFLGIPIILLIDAMCFSSNEYFIAGFKDNKRALLVGETTGGGSGNPKIFEIPFKESCFEIFVSTWIYYRPNGKLLEAKGVKPHIFVKPDLEDIKNKKDKVLERALAEAEKMTR